MLEYELDIIQRLLDNGVQVYYVACNGTRDFCPAWRPGTDLGSISQKIQCLKCKSRVSRGLSWLQHNSDQFFLLNYTIDLSTSKQIDKFIESVLNISKSSSPSQIVEFVNSYIPNLHSSALAAIISRYQNPKPYLFDHFNEYLANLRSVVVNHFAYIHFYDMFKPDQVYIYNGRGIYSPFIDLSIDFGVTYFSYEYPETSFENYWMIENASFFEVKKLSHIIHDFSIQNTGLVESYERPALTWLKNRQILNLETYQGALLNHKLKHMTDHTLFETFPVDKPIISYFTSSENEYANNSDYLASKFISQADLIKHLAKSYPGATVVVRFHPNSSEYDQSNLQLSLSSECLDNLCLILPSDPANSYSLIDASSCIISYGSSIGYEAAFKSKCVITIGYSFYHSFDFHLRPTNLKELDQYIECALSANQKLFPSPAQRKKEALEFVKSYLAFGVRPKYLRRNSYYGGYMFRDKVKTSIRASFLLVLINKLFAALSKLSILAHDFAGNCNKIVSTFKHFSLRTFNLL
jgi:hypothetical protein